MKRRLFYVCLLVATLGVFASQAHATRDEVQFGNAIHVSRDSSIHDAVCFFCDVDADGTVDGDIVVFFGDVHVGTAANHDVVNFFGNIKVDDHAHVGEDMVNFFGNIRLGEDVSIGKDLVAMFGSIHAAESATVGGDRVVEPIWIFWTPILIIALVVILVVRELRNHRRRAYMRYPFPPRP